ncbi:MAG: ribosome recycling factor [Verrucomicrobia bacterium]|nr:ribosome recycling factor [Verrucomicrobiota bacterium]
MNIADDVKNKMKQAIEHLKGEFKNLRTNRVNPQMLDSLKVEVYGSPTPLKSLASVSVQDRQLIITPFDPSTAGAIVKAIQQSNLNLNGIQERNTVRVPVPPLSEELRKDIAKQAKQQGEKGKVAIRDIRQKGNDLARKQKTDGTLAEDEQKKLEKKIQDLTDEFCKEVEKLTQEKEKEILTV